MKTDNKKQMQRVFNKVVKHLLTQNERSMRDAACAYRGDRGLKCAIGCLISNKEYDLDMDEEPMNDMNVYLLRNKFPKLSIFKNSNDEYMRFLARLQFIHDDGYVSTWGAQLKYTAKEYNLTFPIDLI